MTLTSYEEKVLEEVEQYFSEPEESAFGRFSRTLFKPVELVADRIMPTRLMELVGDGVEMSLKTIGNIADKTYSAEQTVEEFRSFGLDVKDMNDLKSADLRIMDDVCEASVSSNTLLALLEGAGCGAGGLTLLAADIPLLLGLSFRTVRRVASCYGYNPDDDGERAIAFKVFELATAGTRDRYDKLLEIDALTDELDGLDPKERAEKAAVMGALLASREMIKRLVASLLSRKLVQAIPIVGATVGGGFNFYFVKDVGLVAQQVYRRRILNSRMNDDDAPTPKTEKADKENQRDPSEAH